MSGDAARDFYLHECVKENWSVRQLDRQINTLFYDRLLASRDKKAVKEEISRTEPGRVEPKEIIRDPYILEFLGIPQGEHFLETDLEQLLISRLQRFMLELLCKGLHNISNRNRHARNGRRPRSERALSR
ncbi:PDDEXK nuclease domain-containing protein [Alistipes communis]|uniref:PDDEXK nuclease domain-containing protein n=1 Tax=Alistipes communis TaxID=2585118 RepID=UPI003A835BD1